MKNAPPAFDSEEERLEALRRYRILDTGPEKQFDRVVDIAKRQFDVPVALVAFMDADRNFFKARGDVAETEAPRDVSFCTHTILSDEVMVVSDTLEDERFVNNPIVVGGPHVRFYAGAPLVSHSGHRIGTVCLFDDKPRQFAPADMQRLKDLAGIVSDHLEMRLAVGNVHDEIEIRRRRAEAEAERIAVHDPLTGLPNRAALQALFARPDAFVDRVVHAFYADIDNFKHANDAGGHHTGDEVLRQTAQALTQVVGPDAFVARISGDEFVALVVGLPDATVDAMAGQILARASRPHIIDERVVSIGLSIGVAATTSSDRDLDSLLRRADLALYEAKRRGGKQHVWYNDKMAVVAGRRQQLIDGLTASLKEGWLEVHYQTIHSAETKGVIGVEALARLNLPTLGPISPAEFVPLAEESGLILALGDYVLRAALRDAAQWPDLFVAVNLSPLQFQQTGLAEEIAVVLEESGFPAAKLQFEVTESVLVSDVDLARQQIESLRALGIRVALDDFGTGYSSLSYLRHLPFDKLKIDQSFVRDIESDQTTATIVQYIVHLAHELNMRVTAEGVETESQEVLLRAAGCDSFQGYRFARPQRAAAISELLAAPKRKTRKAG